MKTSTRAFARYIKQVGGRAAAAGLLPIGVQMIGHVLLERRQASVAVAKSIEAQTQGKITRQMLRPDLY